MNVAVKTCGCCLAEQNANAQYCSNCGQRMEGGLKQRPVSVARFAGANADKTRRTFRIVGGVVGGIIGVGVALGLFGLTREFLDVKPDAFGIVHRHPTFMQRLSVVLLPLGLGVALWFIGYQVADKCFDGIRWLIRKTRPYG